MLSDFTTRSEGNSRWTCSPSESSLATKRVGRSPVKSRGFATSSSTVSSSMAAAQMPAIDAAPVEGVDDHVGPGAGLGVGPDADLAVVGRPDECLEEVQLRRSLGGVAAADDHVVPEAGQPDG